MSTKAIIITGFGINADVELAQAFKLAGAEPVSVHASDLAANPSLLAGAGFLGFPGGFSFGDHLGSGLVLANLLKSGAGAEIRSFVKDGGLVIGICNGFQTITKLGLVPDLDGSGQASVSLVHNTSGQYLDDWVQVEFDPASPCVWTAGLSPRWLPIRHGEGRFVAGSPATLDRIESQHLVAVRYQGRNPNGTTNLIAGVCDTTGRVLGLMPHPEAIIYPEAHPWRRRGVPGGLGLELFEKAVAWRKAHV